MIRNLSLFLEDTADSVVKVLVAQQRSLDSLAKVVLDNRIDLNYVLDEDLHDKPLPVSPCPPAKEDILV